MSKGLQHLANQAISQSYTPEGNELGLRRLASEIKSKHGSDTDSLKIFSLFREKRFRKMMRIGILLGLFNQLSGMAAIMFYSTMIFGELGGGLRLSRILTFVMGFVNLCSALLSILLLKYIGRKVLIVSGQVFLFIDLALLGIFSGYVDVGAVVPTIFVIGFFLFFTYSLASALWIYVGEVLNDQILTVSCIVNMSMTVIITFAFPYAVENLGIHNSFLFFSFCMIIGAIYSAFDLIETKGKTKEQILIEMKAFEKPNQDSNSQDDFTLREIGESSQINSIKVEV